MQLVNMAKDEYTPEPKSRGYKVAVYHDMEVQHCQMY